MILELYFNDKDIKDNHRGFVVAFIKETLSKYDETLFNKLYGKQGTNIKDFCFSVYYKKDSENFKVFISSYNNVLITRIYNACLKVRRRTPLIKCNLSISPKIIGNKIKFMSPLLLRLHSKELNIDEYITYQHPLFNEILNENVKSLCEKYNIKYSPIALKPIEPKNTRTKSLTASYVGTIGTFEIDATDEIKEFLSQTGLGSRRGEGFGLFGQDDTHKQMPATVSGS
jgi:CRISPR-associated endoribonuclease Cas6